jgi:dolichol-phosphate mannosyltransferase
MDLSVVVPVKDEEDNVATLAREIAAAIPQSMRYEILFVDDGSSDATKSVLLGLKTELPSLRVIAHDRNLGQSRAVRTGVLFATAPLIVTLDGDGQNDPADIPKLLAPFSADTAHAIGLVAGVRMKRQDNWSKRWASRWGNRIRRWLLRDGATDVGCGLKAFRREAFLTLPYFDHMHRFLIPLMQREGYEVHFAGVHHRPREHGRSKYGVWDRLRVSIADLFGVMWLQRRFRGPAAPKEL